MRITAPARGSQLICAIVMAALTAACNQPVTPAPSASRTPAPTLPPTPSPSSSQALSGLPTTIDAIQELTPRIGFVAGWGGKPTDVNRPFGIARSDDGGHSWHATAVPLELITTLRFVDDQVGWVSGYATSRDVVLRTADGGNSWQQVLASTVDARGSEVSPQLQAIDGLRAWALIPQAACSPTQCPTDLRRTTDGGRTWATVASGDLALIRFASATRGWMALGNMGNAAQVRTTNDGGTTWSAGFSTNSGGPLGLDAATVNIAWLLTRNGAYCTSSTCSNYELFRTVNGGQSWTSLGNPKTFAAPCSGGHLGGPLFASPLRGWFGLYLGAGGAEVGPGGLLRTEDGGRTWTCATTPPSVDQVSAADPFHIWASAGRDETALYASDDGGRTWHALESTP